MSVIKDYIKLLSFTSHIDRSLSLLVHSSFLPSASLLLHPSFFLFLYFTSLFPSFLFPFSFLLPCFHHNTFSFFHPSFLIFGFTSRLLLSSVPPRTTSFLLFLSFFHLYCLSFTFRCIFLSVFLFVLLLSPFFVRSFHVCSFTFSSYLF